VQVSDALLCSDSAMLFSPLSVPSEYGVVASPRQQAGTPDCIIVASSPAPANEVSDVVSPSAVQYTRGVAASVSAPCSAYSVVSSSALPSAAPSGGERASVVPCVQECATPSVGAVLSRDPAVETAGSSSAEFGCTGRSNKDVADATVVSSAECSRVTRTSDTQMMKFNCALFTKEDEQRALEDVRRFVILI
jgi:hypothetical protein